jgi:hypothetical protein
MFLNGALCIAAVASVAAAMYMSFHRNGHLFGNAYSDTHIALAFSWSVWFTLAATACQWHDPWIPSVLPRLAFGKEDPGHQRGYSSKLMPHAKFETLYGNLKKGETINGNLKDMTEEEQTNELLGKLHEIFKRRMFGDGLELKRGTP